jgi:ribosomal protein S18 acetylase RimI-like enzyme
MVAASSFLHSGANFGYKSSANAASHRILLRATSTTSSSPRILSKFQYKAACEANLKTIATLMSDSFDEKPNLLVRWYSRWNYEEMLKERMVRLIQMKKKHAMIVAMDKENGEENVVGFVEIGVLPLPQSRVQVNEEEQDDTTAFTTLLHDASQENAPLLKVPTIGNLVVSERFRRQGIAKTLMSLAEQEASNWRSTDNGNTPPFSSSLNSLLQDYLCVAVEPQNDAAFRLYRELGFRHVFNAPTTVVVNLSKQEKVLKILCKKIDVII